MNRGAATQHAPLTANWLPATRALPQRCATQPPPAQPITPAPSTKKAAQERLTPCSRVASTSGTITHMV